MTVQLIAGVTAVVHAVTLLPAGDTGAIMTRELIWVTRVTSWKKNGREDMRRRSTSYCRLCRSSKKSYSLQFSSSDPSWQSGLVSHFQPPWIHWPLAHWNSWAAHCTVFSGCFPGQFEGHSSDPSSQSSSPSQRHRSGTHTELLHWKDPGLQVGLGQDFSSEPSEQSLSLSQTKELDRHWPLSH